MGVSGHRRSDRWIPCGFRKAGFTMIGATCEKALSEDSQGSLRGAGLE